MAKYKVTIELMNGAIRGNSLVHMFDVPDDPDYTAEEQMDEAEALGDEYAFQHIAWTVERVDETE